MTHIIIKLQVEGLHSWPEASSYSEDVKFLEHNHRHIFHIQMWKEVTHDDRDVEIILLKRDVDFYLREKYGTPCEFGRMSCEEIAGELLTEFEADAVEVLEDNENGAVKSRVEDHGAELL